MASETRLILEEYLATPVEALEDLATFQKILPKQFQHQQWTEDLYNAFLLEHQLRVSQIKTNINKSFSIPELDSDSKNAPDDADVSLQRLVSLLGGAEETLQKELEKIHQQTQQELDQIRENSIKLKELPALEVQEVLEQLQGFVG